MLRRNRAHRATPILSGLKEQTPGINFAEGLRLQLVWSTFDPLLDYPLAEDQR